MPTYQYACTACDHRFEAVQAFTDSTLTECPECTGRLRKVFSSVGIVFKGSGFYRTDSRAGNVDAASGAPEKSSDKSSEKSSEKSSASSDSSSSAGSKGSSESSSSGSSSSSSNSSSGSSSAKSSGSGSSGGSTAKAS